MKAIKKNATEREIFKFEKKREKKKQNVHEAKIMHKKTVTKASDT